MAYPQNEDDDLATAIRAAFDKRDHSHAEWIEGTVELGTLFAAARDQHDSDRAFGHWLVDNNLDDVGHTDRAALIAMGRHPETLRQVLQEASSISPRVIYEAARNRFPQEGKPPPSAPEPPQMPESLSPMPETAPPDRRENVVQLRPAPEPAAPAEPIADLAKRAPKLAKVLEDPALLRLVLDRMGDTRRETATLLCRIGAMKGGKVALQRWAETLRDHPNWKPALHDSRVTVRLLDAGMGTAAGAVVRKTSPDGLHKVIDRALEVTNRVHRPPPTPTFRERPPRPSPTETPQEDEAIVIQGKTIRERGHDPAAYPMVWAAVRAWAMIDGYMKEAWPSPGSRGAILDYAIPFIRDCDSDILAAVWREISTALKTGPKDGDTHIPLSRMRIK